MKKNERRALKEKSTAELQELVKEMRNELQKLKFQLAAGKLKNIGEVRSLRKKIARALTFVHAARVQG